MIPQSWVFHPLYIVSRCIPPRFSFSRLVPLSCIQIIRLTLLQTQLPVFCAHSSGPAVPRIPVWGRFGTSRIGSCVIAPAFVKEAESPS